MIEAKKVSMFYGSFCALNSVSFHVRENEIVGLLGPNGAGKTTLMRILTTFIYPTQGTATVCGFDILENPNGARKNLGYLPETPPLYTDMRVDEFIKFIGRARGLNAALYQKRKDWVVEACGLSPVWKHNIYELSMGYRQRVGLAQALLHDPKVVILDEPTSGLDPIQIIAVRDLIRELAKTKTVIFSTHILQEASAISNRLLIINQGKIAAQGTVDEIRAVHLKNNGMPQDTLEDAFLEIFRRSAKAKAKAGSGQ
jgi:ABC-2 type transport system ATP-binding protein